MRREAGSPTFKYQKFWIFNDIDPNWHNAVRFGNTPGSTYTPRYFTINGLSGRPPGAPGNGDPNIDAMHNHDTALHGHVGDRDDMTAVRTEVQPRYDRRRERPHDS